MDIFHTITVAFFLITLFHDSISLGKIRVYDISVSWSTEERNDSIWFNT